MLADPTQTSFDPSQRVVRSLGTRASDDAPAEHGQERFGAWGHDPHVHDFHQFLYAPVGHAVVWAQDRTFHLSGTVALWVPAGVWHSARFDDDCLVAPLAFPAEDFPLPYADCAEVVVSPRRRSLLLAHLRRRLDDAEPTAELFGALLDDGTLIPLPTPQSTVTTAVAAQVGFTSTNGFILAFRRYFDVTPKAYADGLCA